MRERIITLPGAGIVADSGVALDWTPEVFQPEYWRRRGATAGQAARGRGAVLFMKTEFGEWAFRHYRRGGLVGRILEDHYVWLGMNRTRSIREWRLLKRLFEEGLPVPRPIAACFQRRGGSYTADLITRRIPGARPLSRHLAEAALPDSAWRRLGSCVRRFHDAGVCHADLTAHNLLLDHGGQPWLLDFDRGDLRPPGRWRQTNLRRLLRSMNKISMENAATQFAPANWASFLEGYGESSA
jgi:3-deoxy-D-manno-octulosonic acid kinase